MTWTVRFEREARNELRKIASKDAVRIKRYFAERVVGADDPRQLARRLAGGPPELWRFRIGDFRAIARIEGDVLVVLVLSVGHRRDVYRRLSR